MKFSLECGVNLFSGYQRVKLGAAVEWRLYTGLVRTPVLIWLGACREMFLKGGDYREVVAGLLRAAAAKHVAAVTSQARELGAEVSLDVEAIVAEFSPQICAELRDVPGVVEEITQALPAVEAPPVPPAAVDVDPPAKEKVV